MGPYDGYPNEQFYLLAVIHSVHAVIGLIEMVVAVVHSTYCCATVCVGSRLSYQVPKVVYTEKFSGSYTNAAFQTRVDMCAGKEERANEQYDKAFTAPPPYQDVDMKKNSPFVT